MPNPDFPQWFDIGVIVRNTYVEQGTRAPEWVVAQACIEWADQPGSTGRYLIQIMRFDNGRLVPAQYQTVTLEQFLRSFTYTGLCIAPDGTRRTEDQIVQADARRLRLEGASEDDARAMATAHSITRAVDADIITDLAGLAEHLGNIITEEDYALTDADEPEVVEPFVFREPPNILASVDSALAPVQEAVGPEHQWVRMRDPTEDTREATERASGRPLIQVGQNWLLGQPHAGVWRVFGFGGSVHEPDGTWYMRNANNSRQLRVTEDWLSTHAMRQTSSPNPTSPDPTPPAPRRTAYDHILADELVDDSK